MSEASLSSGGGGSSAPHSASTLHIQQRHPGSCIRGSGRRMQVLRNAHQKSIDGEIRKLLPLMLDAIAERGPTAVRLNPKP